MQKKEFNKILIPLVSLFSFTSESYPLIPQNNIRSEVKAVADTQTGAIKGNIKERKTGEPLTGATIQIEGSSVGTITDLDGNFEFQNLSSGNYKIGRAHV